MNRKPLILIGLILTLLVALTFSTGVLQTAPSASAHAPWGALVVRQDASRPVPVVDGFCGTEYLNSLRYLILYRPRFNWNPAQLRMISTDNALYVCLSGMSVHAGTVPPYPFVSLAFDTAHNGGALAQSDDLVFTVDELGSRAAQRGNGAGGFDAAPEVTGWTAAADSLDGVSWTAEFSIPLSLIGGGAPLTNLGFHVRHNWLRYGGDDYAWPSTGGWNVPTTWGDLWWGAPAVGSGTVGVDVSRITQGLEYDTSAHVAYDLIAGKDTLARAQLYTLGPVRDIIYSACRVQQVTHRSVLGLSFPIAAPTRIMPPRFTPVARINPAPYGFFNGSPVADCWIPGSWLNDPGDYRIQLQIQVSGSSAPQTFDLGTKTFLPTGDMRLLIYPWIFQPEHTSEFRLWTSDLTASAVAALNAYQRMHPLRAGVGYLDWSGLMPRTTGLRYYIHPAVYRCQTREGETNNNTRARCDAETRNDANRALQDYNARLRALDAGDGRRRDQLDWGMVLVATLNNGGGQSCWSGQRVAGGGLDTEVRASDGRLLIGGSVGKVVGQELDHCMGQVNSTSPNHWPAESQHSKNGLITLYRNLPMINMISHAEISEPPPVLFPWFTIGHDATSIDEGWEWNEMRNRLLAMPHLARLPAAAGPAQAQSSSLFRLLGTLNLSDTLTVNYSARVDDLPLDLTPAGPLSSSYALVFLDAGNAELSRLPFEVVFTGTHEVFSVVPVDLTTLLPTNATQVQIKKDKSVLYSQTFGAQAPIVSGVVITPDGKGNVHVQWNASDGDSSDLTYSLYFVPDSSALASAGQTSTANAWAGSPPLLLTGSLTDTTFFFQTDLAPATTSGKLIVEASDGYQTSTASSGTFTIPKRPPIVTIVSPVMSETLIAGQSVALAGLALDFTTGPLTDTQLGWQSNLDGALGSGGNLNVQLSTGWQTITLTASAPSGLTGTASIRVNVLADSSGDGLPNVYQAAHPCLTVGTFEGDVDQDGDGLMALAEYRRGTDPCSADTDFDGFSDGDEARLGSNLHDFNSTPAADQLFIPVDEVDLGSCPAPKTQSVPMQTLSPTLTWNTAVSADWLSVAGGGTGSGSFTITAQCQGLGAGLYTGNVLIGVAGGPLRVIEVSLLSPYRTYLPLVVKSH